MKPHFHVLNGWRGLAASMVAIGHLLLADHIHEVGFVRNFPLYVDFFFVLSGFVISYAYTDILRDFEGIVVFLLRRIGRLWPLHLTVLTTFVLFETVRMLLVAAHYLPPQATFARESGTSLRQLIESIFLVQAIGIDHIHSWNGPAWSISTEFWVYVLYACACFMLTRHSLAFAAAVLALGAAVILVLFSPTYLEVTFDFGILRCFYGFAMGHLTYRLWSARSRKLVLPSVVEVGAVTLFFAYISVTTAVPGSVWTMVAPLIFSAVVWVFAFEAGAVSKLMRNRVVQALGAWSYSIYMIHDHIAFVIFKFVHGCQVVAQSGHGSRLYHITCLTLFPASALTRLDNKWFLDIVTLIYLAVVFALASATYRLIEQPGRRYFNRLSRSVETVSLKSAPP